MSGSNSGGERSLASSIYNCRGGVSEVIPLFRRKILDMLSEFGIRLKPLVLGDEGPKKWSGEALAMGID